MVLSGWHNFHLGVTAPPETIQQDDVDRRHACQQIGSVSARATVLVRLRGVRVWGRGEKDWLMECVGCGSTAASERSERTAQGYRRFRCRACGKQFNERSSGSLNRAQYPSDLIALVVLWRLRYKLALRDLPEMFLIRGIVFSPSYSAHSSDSLVGMVQLSGIA
jgi:hypothetical protein